MASNHAYFYLSFGKETIPIDVHTTSIDDWNLYSSCDGLVATGLKVRLSVVVCFVIDVDAMCIVVDDGC